MSITLWKPEPDVLIHQALGKACEEANELSGILARCLIQGLNSSEPVTGKPNRQALSDEIADLDAAVQWLRELIGDEYDEARADRKLSGFRRWQRMLEEDMRDLPYQCDACSTPGYGPDAQCRCSPSPVEREVGSDG
ncbi:hypothetical protein [Rhizobium mongolense]|uniref:Uncharacterized protein n=1 Tax=Rhizobium mongolense TaxID=57676 RepID=A0A7W6RR10_9HYPH|nr:hypothetical protein [Rhizobium mongolense]MBB4277061.1 hypothetical protein [Rhizobium mongolense]